MTQESSKKPHIIYILTKLELGGAQKVCLALFQGAQKQFSSSLISGKDGVLVKKIHKTKEVFLIDSFKREVNFSNIFIEIKNFLSVVKILKKIKKQHSSCIVHTHSTKAGIIGRWAAFFAGIKKRVHTIHGYGFNAYQPIYKKFLIYLAELVTLPITSKYICVSKNDLKTGIKLFPGFKKKSLVIRAAVNWKTFYLPTCKSTSCQNTSKFTIGTISCFKPQKNLIDLLKAFNHISKKYTEKNLFLEIVGDGELRPQITTWIKKYNLEEKIILHGWQNNVLQFLQHWDVFALSSLWEGLPCSVIEARLQKKPIIAYNVGGLNEVVFNNKNGFLITPGKWIDLAEKLSLLLTDQKTLNKCISYNDHLEDFKDEIMLQKHLLVYDKLASNS